jgi:hypothetical protein
MVRQGQFPWCYSQAAVGLRDIIYETTAEVEESESTKWGDLSKKGIPAGGELSAVTCTSSF